ncbi:zinc finger matrin-type protein 4 isoform X2 [Mycteria americana]|uniref:zinc finger matrin-type protein 4 isoform X2 n=1 Tax=Mycteria americana TaxID=33587 RepID=UPI003F587E27
MRRGAAGPGAALRSAAEPIAAARGGAGAAAEARPAPSAQLAGAAGERRGERRRRRLGWAPSLAASREQLGWPRPAGPASGAKMKSSDIDQELFTESYCKVCSAQLISESQRVAHYESRKHASKVRLYYMLHPIDGGCPAKKLRSENGSDGDSVDKNKCCTLCNMSFTSAVVAESHYQGKIHAKRLKLLLGEQPTLKATETTLSSLKQPHTDGPPAVPSPHQRRDSDRYCQLCAAWFNNPMMAQQHYDGKKHKKNAARADLLEQLGKTLDLGELRGLKRSYTCNICNITLNSIEQYHAHLKGSKHQTNLKNQ